MSPNLAPSPYTAGDPVHPPSATTAKSPFVTDVETEVADVEHEAETVVSEVEHDVEVIVPEAEKVFGEVEHDVEDIVHPA